MKNLLHKITEKALESWQIVGKRFPLIAALLFFNTVYFILLTHDLVPDGDHILPWQMAAQLSIVFALMLSLLQERLNTKYLSLPGQLIITAIHFVLLALLIKTLPGDYKIFSFFFAWTAYLLFFALVPYINNRKGLEIYSARLIGNAIITGFFAAILLAGLMIILATIQTLFYQDLDFDYYLDIFIIVSTFVAPLIFLSQLPEHDREMEERDFFRPLQLALTRLILPLLGVYSVILYIYFAKTLIQDNLAESAVGYLVSAYAAVTLAAVYLAEPLRQQHWVNLACRIFPVLLLPLLLLMGIDIYPRIQAYGFTANRYFIILISGWSAFAGIYHILTRGKRNFILPLTLAILLIMAVYSPLSAFAVSGRSQSHELTVLLEKHSLLENNEILPYSETVEIPGADVKRIRSLIDYIQDYDLTGYVPYWPQDEDGFMRSYKVLEHLQLPGSEADGYYKESGKYFTMDYLSNSWDISDYKLASQVRIRNDIDRNLHVFPDSPESFIRFLDLKSDGMIHYSVNHGPEQQLDIRQAIGELARREIEQLSLPTEKQTLPAQEDLTFKMQTEAGEISMLLLAADGSVNMEDRTKDPTIYYIHFWILSR